MVVGVSFKRCRGCGLLVRSMSFCRVPPSAAAACCCFPAPLWLFFFGGGTGTCCASWAVLRDSELLPPHAAHCCSRLGVGAGGGEFSHFLQLHDQLFRSAFVVIMGPAVAAGRLKKGHITFPSKILARHRLVHIVNGTGGGEVRARQPPTLTSWGVALGSKLNPRNVSSLQPFGAR